MIALAASRIQTVAVVGAHCDDIAIGAGATLSELTRQDPKVVVHALVFTGGGTEREVEEKNALAAMCPSTDVRLTVCDLPDGRLPGSWNRLKRQLAEFRRSCDPDVIFAPQRGDNHQDHRLVAELIHTEFRTHLVLGYEILKWESDLPSPTIYQPVSDAAAQRKTAMLHECYPSQADHDWFDDEAFLGLMRVRGVQCHSRYAEAFIVEKAVLNMNNAVLRPLPRKG